MDSLTKSLFYGKQVTVLRSTGISKSLLYIRMCIFSFVYEMYLNIASYLCGEKIKSKLGNKTDFHLCTLESA